MATLEIGTWSSRCSACGKGASMSETGHITELGYSTKPGTAGCGEAWDSVILTYTYGGNEAMAASVEHLKQDNPALANLPWDWFKWPEDDQVKGLVTDLP